MKYPENLERSAEYLRLTLGLMSKHEAAFNPITYAVWYEYASGRNRALNQELDNHLKADSKLDEDVTRRLYAAYVAELDPQTIHIASEAHNTELVTGAPEAPRPSSDRICRLRRLASSNRLITSRNTAAVPPWFPTRRETARR